MFRRFLAALILMSAAPAAAEPALMRISTENTEQHVQTRMVQRFVERLNRDGKGVVKAELHFGAALFRDRDVLRALADGQVEMAVPGTWQLDRYAPDLSVFLLPAFWGRDADLHHDISDGAIGRTAAAQLEKAAEIHVLGRWIDLGHAHLFFRSPDIRSLQDAAGLRIRIAGGDANAAMIKGLAAIALVIPWPDLPDALDRQAVDGVLTTHETVLSAALWKNGISRCLETRSYFAQYVPIIAGEFWNALTPIQKRLTQDAWDSIVEEARGEAAAAQAEARRRLIAAGIDVLSLSADELATLRGQARTGEAELAKSLDIPQDFLKQATAAIETNK